MRFLWMGLAGLTCFVPAPVGGSPSPDPGSELRAVETAFARTMADRDRDAFRRFLAPDVVFFGSGGELRGPEAVTEGWAPYFDGKTPPFSWEPEVVGVTADGSLGFTSGPVYDPEGNRIGTFNSVWRKSDGTWRIVFDRGCPVTG